MIRFNILNITENVNITYVRKLQCSIILQKKSVLDILRLKLLE